MIKWFNIFHRVKQLEQEKKELRRSVEYWRRQHENLEARFDKLSSLFMGGGLKNASKK